MKRLDGRDPARIRASIDSVPEKLSSAPFFVPIDEKLSESSRTALAVRALVVEADFEINLDDFPPLPIDDPRAVVEERVVVDRVPELDEKGKEKVDGRGRPVVRRVSKRERVSARRGEGGWIRGFGPGSRGDHRGDVLCLRHGDGTVFALENAAFFKEYRPAAPGETPKA